MLAVVNSDAILWNYQVSGWHAELISVEHMPRSEKVRLYNESVFSVLGESILSLLKLELYQEVRRLDDFLPSSIFSIAVVGELPIIIW